MNKVNAPILITGARGNVGSALLSHLQERGVPLRAALRDPGRLEGLPPGIPTVRFDFTAPETYADAFGGVERLFLLRPPQIANVRRDMGPALTQAARSGVRHVVFLSLLGADRNPLLPHAALEKLLLESPMETTFLRAGFFMQNLSTTHRPEIRDQGELFIPAGGGKTAFIDVRDIAAVAARVLTEPGHGGRAYPLTGSVALDYDAVAAQLSEVLDRPVRYSNPSLPRFIWRHWRAGQPLAYVAVLATIYTTARFGRAAAVTPHAATLLGRQPTTLARFVRDYAAVWAAPQAYPAGS